MIGAGIATLASVQTAIGHLIFANAIRITQKKMYVTSAQSYSIQSSGLDGVVVAADTTKF